MHCCASEAANDSLVVLPFWVQERALTWPEHLRGSIIGLRPVTTAADILRSATTSAFYRLAAIVDTLGHRERDHRFRRHSALARFARDFSRHARPRHSRLPEMESSLRGAAVYALEHLGFRPKKLPRGRLVRHRPKLAAKHRERRTPTGRTRANSDSLGRGIGTRSCFLFQLRVSQFAEVQFLHPAPVRLRNRDAVILDPHAFALLRQMA